MISTTLARHLLPPNSISRTIVSRKPAILLSSRFISHRLNRPDSHLPHKPLLPFARTVASAVSNRPGSQTIPHAARNIKEETSNSATDIAKSIAGNIPFPEAMTPDKINFVCPKCRPLVFWTHYSQLRITSIIAGTVPRPLMVMGLAGMKKLITF